MTRRVYIAGIIAFLFAAVISAPVCAQTAQTENDVPLTAADSLAMLDRKVSKWDKLLAKLPSLSAFMQIQYTWERQGDEPSVSQFRIRRARITLAGNIYRELVDYNFMVEFAGSPKIVDAYLRVTPWKQFNVQVGSFRPAFTLENYFYGATTTELIEYPQIVSKMTTIGDISGMGSGSAGRDIGLQAYGGFFNSGGFSRVQYYAGIFNGNGLDYNSHSSKDFAAMLRINPVKSLALVGSVYRGKWSPSGNRSYAARNRWSAGFMYDDSKWFARGEYISGETGGLKTDNLPVAPAGEKLLTDGAYLLAGVWFCGGKVAPIVRAEFCTQNTEARSRTTDMAYTAGLFYRPLKYLRVQLNYTATTYSYTPAGFGSRPMGNRISVMLTGMF